MKRLIMAALGGGIAMFIWMSIAHLATPLGRIGFQAIPNEQPVLSALQASIGNRQGLYFYPWMDQNAEGMKQYEAKLAANASGILIYHAPGAKAMQPSQLVTEFLLEVLEALLAAILLSQTRLHSYVARVVFVLLAGVLGSLVTNGSYWNWYGFPTSYTVASMFSQAMGFLCAGLVIGAVMKPARP